MILSFLSKEGLGVRIAHLTCLEVSKQPGELQQTSAGTLAEDADASWMHRNAMGAGPHQK